MKGLKVFNWRSIVWLQRFYFNGGVGTIYDCGGTAWRLMETDIELSGHCADDGLKGQCNLLWKIVP